MPRLEQPYSAKGQSINDMKERFRRAIVKVKNEQEAQKEKIKKEKLSKRKNNKKRIKTEDE